MTQKYNWHVQPQHSCCLGHYHHNFSVLYLQKGDSKLHGFGLAITAGATGFPGLSSCAIIVFGRLAVEPKIVFSVSGWHSEVAFLATTLVLSDGVPKLARAICLVAVVPGLILMASSAGRNLTFALLMGFCTSEGFCMPLSLFNMLGPAEHRALDFLHFVAWIFKELLHHEVEFYVDDSWHRSSTLES